MLAELARELASIAGWGWVGRGWGWVWREMGDGCVGRWGMGVEEDGEGMWRGMGDRGCLVSLAIGVS